MRHEITRWCLRRSETLAPKSSGTRRKARALIAALGVVGCRAEWAKPRRLRDALAG